MGGHTLQRGPWIGLKGLTLLSFSSSAREGSGRAEFLGALTRQRRRVGGSPLHFNERVRVYGHSNNMENPHAERQAVLLERIVKNAVSVTPLH